MKKFLCLCLALLMGPALAAAQLSMGGIAGGSAINGFSFCRPYRGDHLKLPNTLLPPEPYTDYPALFDSIVDPGLMADLRLTTYGGLVTSAAAYDVIIYPDALGGAGDAKLHHEIDYYNPVTGRLIMHFLKTLSLTSENLVYVCGGKSSITTSQQAIAATWNSGYKGVWHFGDGVTLSLLDSTVNANNATNVNAVTAITGKIGGAAQFTIPAPVKGPALYPSFNLGNAVSLQSPSTIECWYYLDNPLHMALFEKYGENEGTQFYVSGANGVVGRLAASVSGEGTVSEGVAARAGDRKHAALVWTGQAVGTHKINLYVDGLLVDVFDFYPGGGNSITNAFVGIAAGGGAGWIDELRAHGVPRSPDWIRAGYLMQDNPAYIWSSGPRL